MNLVARFVVCLAFVLGASCVVLSLSANAQTPPPSAKPFPTPPPTSVAKPFPKPYEHFLDGDYYVSPKIYNEFSPGSTGSGGAVGAVGEFPLAGLTFPGVATPSVLIGFDYRTYSYRHDQGNVEPLGSGTQQVFVPSFTARDTDFDARLGLKIAEPRIYIGIGYLHREQAQGSPIIDYPKLGGFGFGVEKLPDLDQTFSIYGSAWYYPSVQGDFGAFSYGNCPGAGGVNLCASAAGTLQYRVLKYQIGGTLTFGGSNSPLFLDLGALGDRSNGKQNAPSNTTTYGPYIGLGLHF